MPAPTVIADILKDLTIDVAAVPFQRPLERYLGSTEALSESAAAKSHRHGECR